MKKMYGQTLVELMIFLAIGGIALTTAIPAFTSTFQRNQQTQTVNQMLAGLHYARSAAVLGSKTTTLCSGAITCNAERTWRRKLLIFDDTNLNGQLDNDENLLHQLSISEGYSWHWSNFRNQPHLQFENDGTTRALNGTFTLCHDNTPSRQIVLNLTGRARTQAAPATAPCD